MSKHTPGPWWVEKRKDSHSPQIQAKHRGEGSSYCVATVNFWESPEANARLIAMAPELLDALKVARDTTDRGALFDEWNNLIAKAEGAAPVVAKPVTLCTCGKALETPRDYAAHCKEFPDHFAKTVAE